MITLITGQPGAGKTLRTIWMVEDLRKRENRTVYYSGITDLALPWTELAAPEKWYDCPLGSIIVIDECQRLFRPRSNGSTVPESVAAMETHRHKGLDIFLVTQHPMLLDSNIRRLVGTHVHVMRAFGAHAARVHQWGEVRENCDKSRTGSQSALWKYPKEVFSYYKSAELHTHKFRFPPRLLFLVLGPLLLAGLIYYLASHLMGLGDKKKPSAGLLDARASEQTTLESYASGSIRRPQDWIAAHQPRLPGVPHTAPAYDDVTRPAHAPHPAGCVQIADDCRCYSEQGTALAMLPDICASLVKTGFFRAWDSGFAAGAGNFKEKRK